MDFFYILEIAVALTVIFITFFVLASKLISPKKLELKNAHVLITGGSSGIGKSVAEEVLKKGANVSILARNSKRLDEAKADLENHIVDKSRQKVVCASVDIAHDCTLVADAVKKAVDILGPVDMLVNCAGMSSSGKFEDIPVSEMQKIMDINFNGSWYTTLAVVKEMKKRQHGRIVFTSSQAGQIGLFGFTAYSASKYALRGLAEALRMELQPHNIYVSIVFPPDTDTPGLKAENETKIKETMLISETAGVLQPEDVAKIMVQGSIDGKFLISCGLDGWMLSCVTSGFSPVISFFEAIPQILFMGVFRVIALFYLGNFNRIVKKCKEEEEKATS